MQIEVLVHILFKNLLQQGLDGTEARELLHKVSCDSVNNEHSVSLRYILLLLIQNIQRTAGGDFFVLCRSSVLCDALEMHFECLKMISETE